MRGDVVELLAGVITALRPGHPARVAVDGRSAAGKTTLADELAAAVRARGRECLRASIDGFHPPGHGPRSAAGGYTPASYYEEGYDYAAFRDLLLAPLGPGGDRRYRGAIFDSLRDVPLPVEWRRSAEDAIALVDGVFLLRPQLAGYWDYVIWLDIDFETMIARARRRDVAWVGTEDAVEERYRRRWIPAHQLYEGLTHPEQRADAVVDNRDFAAPRLLWITGSTAG